MAIATEARNATLDDLSELLQRQQAAKVDVVVPAAKVRSSGGRLVIEDALATVVPDAELGMREVRTPGTFTPTSICDDGISEKLGIHRAYLRRLRNERPDLYDANVNGWLHGLTTTWDEDDPTARSGVGASHTEVIHQPDGRKFLVRGFAGDDPDSGIARAFLSDGFGFIDHLDVLGATFEGIRDAGVDVNVTRCDLTERRMYVRVEAPAVKALAPVLLAGYRNPFDDPEVERLRNHGWDVDAARAAAAREGLGYDPGTEPVVFAGFTITNSETGGGAASIVPTLVVQVCRNGLKIERDALRKVHLGSRLEAGVVRWSDDTIKKSLDLVVAQARDAVRTFLDVDYVKMVVGGIEEKAAVPVANAADTVQLVGKRLGFGEERIAGILDHFIRGAQMTAGGVLNAVTSYAQCVPDADEAHVMESKALEALDLAAAAR